jgi:hypothetical protein
MAEQSKMTLGRISNLQDAIYFLQRDIGTGILPAYGSLVEVVRDFVEGIDASEDSVVNLARFMATPISAFYTFSAAIEDILTAFWKLGIRIWEFVQSTNDVLGVFSPFNAAADHVNERIGIMRERMADAAEDANYWRQKQIDLIASLDDMASSAAEADRKTRDLGSDTNEAAGSHHDLTLEVVDLIGVMDELNRKYDQTFDTLPKVMQSSRDLIGVAQDQARAMEGSAEAAIAMSKSTEGLNTDFDKLETATEQSSREIGEWAEAQIGAKEDADSLTDAISNQISTITTDLSRGLAEAIVHWRGFWETMKSIAQTFIIAILRLVIEGFLVKIIAKIGELLATLGKTSGGGGTPWWKKVLGGIGTVLGGGGVTAGGGGSPGATGKPPSYIFGWTDPAFPSMPPISDFGLPPHLEPFDIRAHAEAMADLGQAYGIASGYMVYWGESAGKAAEKAAELTDEMRALAYWGVDPTMEAFAQGERIWTNIVERGNDLATMLYGLGAKLLETKDVTEAQRIAWDLLGGEILLLRDQYQAMGLQLPELIQQALNYAEANKLIGEGALTAAAGIDAMNEAGQATKQTLEDMAKQGLTFMEVMERAARQGWIDPTRETMAGHERNRPEGSFTKYAPFLPHQEPTPYREPKITINGDVYGFDDFERKVGEAWNRTARSGGFAGTGELIS